LIAQFHGHPCLRREFGHASRQMFDAFFQRPMHCSSCAQSASITFGDSACLGRRRPSPATAAP
jgi:hypothetical protein